MRKYPACFLLERLIVHPKLLPATRLLKLQQQQQLPHPQTLPSQQLKTFGTYNGGTLPVTLEFFLKTFSASLTHRFFHFRNDKVAMNATQQPGFDCSMQNWIDTEIQSNANSATTTKSISDTGEEQQSAISPTTTISLSEATNQNNSSCASTPKESVLKASEGPSKSYAMDDLLRNDHTSASHGSRKQKRKQTNPTQKLLADEQRETSAKKRPHEEFITELSRSTTDALTRALSKCARLAENGLQELQNLVREAVVSSLENMSANRSNLQTSILEPIPTNGEVEVEADEKKEEHEKEDQKDQPMQNAEEAADTATSVQVNEMFREPPVNLPNPREFEGIVPQPRDLLDTNASNSWNHLSLNDDFIQFLRCHMNLLASLNKNPEIQSSMMKVLHLFLLLLNKYCIIECA